MANAIDPTNQVVKFKEERSDPEIERRIQLLTAASATAIIKEEPLDSNNGIIKVNNNINDNGRVNNANSDVDESLDDDDDDDVSQDTQTSSEKHQNEDDDKKSVEPVKSSNEILTELFKVFNVAPPDELLDDKNLINKVKKHKKDKKKKHKKNKSADEQSDSESGISKGKRKHKKKKKHKHKHKDGDKVKEKGKGKDKEKGKTKDVHRDSVEKKKIREGDKSKEQDRPKHKEVSKHLPLNKNSKDCKTSSDHKRRHDKSENENNAKKRRSEVFNDFYKDFRDKDSQRGKKHSSRGRELKIKKENLERVTSDSSKSEGEISDTTLSDEETYLREREPVRETSSPHHSKNRSHNSFYAGLKRTRSRDRVDDRDRDCARSRDKYRDRGRERSKYSSNSRRYSRRSRSRSRTRSRSRYHDLGIDKKRLLEIARKNAISMFKRGNLPGCDNMTQEVKDKVLLKMRYGGRTVEDLTEFCKKISNGEHLSDLSSDEDSDVDKSGNAKAFHHPFQIKEREPIVMHIRNCKPIVPVVVKTDDQTKAITMQFPVSSGQQHRLTESWILVEAKDKLASLPALSTSNPAANVFKNTMPKNVLGKSLPVEEEQEPAFKSVPPTVATAAESVTSADVNVVKTEDVLTEPINGVATASVETPRVDFVPDVPIPSSTDTVFSQNEGPPLDVSSIISKRLNAMRRLQENPMDSEALKMMYSSQREMTSWASSKHLPGQFTGSTGANILKPSELNSGPQVWARRDQLTSSKPVTGGVGMQLLQKMGWKPGEGLGRDKNGALQPLLLDVKLDKRGLVAQDDCNGFASRKLNPPKKRPVSGKAQAQLNIQDRHPVCLLNELTSKRKWTPPTYTLTNQKGPSHSRMFMFSVSVNGETFTPERACNTKKEAKLLAAKFCLQQIGILPAD
uniref:Protein SON n=1 Tax=Glossina palpalis gambiensis TaxID=67801 RepID=A0A1B0BKL6_9MUSC